MAGKKAFLPDHALKKAMDLFWERGYEGSSIEDLVQCTGIGRGSLYATFGDKHALYLAALDQYCASQQASLSALQQQEGSLRQILENTFQTYIDLLLNDPARRGCFLVNANVEMAPHDLEVYERVQAAYNVMEQAFLEFLVKAQAAGELPAAADPQQFALFFLGTLISIRVLARARAERRVLQDLAQTALLVLR
ncbi:MAG TPA: TetR/AcrR family transcriptional regulator [Ktedonobacteraceae bacterium]